MMLSAVTTILTDFSGVLADDLKPTWLTFCEILKVYDKPALTLQEFRYTFSMPYWKIFEGFGLPEQTAKVRCLQLYKKLIQGHAPTITVFSDVRSALKSLSKTKKLGIVSQTPRSTLEPFLVQHDLLQYFEKIIALEDSTEQKPSPLPLLIACESLGCKPSEAAYLGDQYEDIIAAKNARIFSVAISRKHSYHTYPRLLTAKPDLIISDLRELVTFGGLRC